MKRCSFVVHGETSVDEMGLLLKKLADPRDVFLLNVPEKVLIGSVAVSDTFDSPHRNSILFYDLVFYSN